MQQCTLGCMTEESPHAKKGTRSPSAMPFARSTPRSVAALNALTNQSTGQRDLLTWTNQRDRRKRVDQSWGLQQ